MKTRENGQEKSCVTSQKERRKSTGRPKVHMPHGERRGTTKKKKKRQVHIAVVKTGSHILSIKVHATHRKCIKKRREKEVKKGIRKQAGNVVAPRKKQKKDQGGRKNLRTNRGGQRGGKIIHRARG